jgi:hypothetical protein
MNTIDERLECSECGYDLFGLEENRCPECGHAFNLAELRHPEPSREDPDPIRKWAARLLILVLLLNTVGFYRADDRWSIGRLFGIIEVAELLLPQAFFFAAGLFLFSTELARKRIGVFYMLYTCVMALWALRHQDYSLTSWAILGSLERGVPRWGLALMGVCGAKAIAILRTRGAYSPSWRWSLAGTIMLGALGVAFSFVGYACHYHRWHTSAHGLAMLLLPRHELEESLLTCVLVIPVVVPIGAVLALLWEMPLAKPIDFRVRIDRSKSQLK